MRINQTNKLIKLKIENNFLPLYSLAPLRSSSTSYSFLSSSSSSPSSSSSSSSSGSQSCKLVDQRLLLLWDVPAVNGIIHVLEAPLTAPAPLVSHAPAPLAEALEARVDP